MSINVPRTFLDCVQRTRQECQIPGGGPSRVTGQSGILGRLVSWVSSAWMDLQSFHPNWRFMREEAMWMLNGVRNVEASEISNDHVIRDWIRDDFRVYSTEDGPDSERILTYIPYNEFREEYIRGEHRTTVGQPTAITVDPSNGIVVYPTPNTSYTFVGEYYRGAEEMTQDTDEPDIPVEFRMLLVFAAAAEYGRYEAANEVYQHFHYKHNRTMRQLEASQLPRPQMAGASGLG